MPALGFPRPRIGTSLWEDPHALNTVSQWDLLSMPSTAPFEGCWWRGALELPPFGDLSLGSQTLTPEYKFHRALYGSPVQLPHTLYIPHPRPSPSTVFLFRYEDPVALDGGEEGMDIITHILALAPQLLKDSGHGGGVFWV